MPKGCPRHCENEQMKRVNAFQPARYIRKAPALDWGFFLLGSIVEFWEPKEFVERLLACTLIGASYAVLVLSFHCCAEGIVLYPRSQCSPLPQPDIC